MVLVAVAVAVALSFACIVCACIFAAGHAHSRRLNAQEVRYQFVEAL